MVAFVQNVGALANTSGTSSTTIVIPVTVTTTAGNLLVAWGRCQNGSRTVSSVADSQGNTWTIDADHFNDINTSCIASCIIAGGKALTSGDTITITISTTAAFRAGGAAEFSGLAVSGGNPVTDIKAFLAAGAGLTSAPSGGPSAQASELVITYAGSQSTTTITLTTADPLSGGTWTAINNPSASYINSAYQIATSVSSFKSTWTVASNHDSAGIVSYQGTSGTAHAGTAALSGSGTLGGAGVFAGAAALSGSGTLGGTGTVALTRGQGIAALSGSGTLGGTGTGIFVQFAALSGTGTLTGTWIGVLQQPPAALSGIGNLNLSGVKLGFTAGLSGNGTLSVLQATGGLVFASPGAAVPYAYPMSSQVMVAPPGSSRWCPLGSVGHVTALTYSFTCPGGADAMSCTVMVPAAYRSQLFWPGWQVKITRGGHQVWSGKLDEPVPTASGWTLTAVGDGNRGQDFLAVYTSTWPNSQPDESITAAISRGLPWVNPGVGTPSGAWYGQAVDSGAQTVTALLNLICTRGALTWYANSQPGGLPGTDLTVFPLPTIVNRLLVATTPVPRTLGGDINTIWIRYQTAAASTGSGGTGSADFDITSVANQASVTAHGTIEAPLMDLSNAGTMSAGAAQAVGSSVLGIYQRASYAGPFTARYGQLLTTGGQPIDPGTDQASTVCRLILTDFAYGGEVQPNLPVTFIVGSYSYDDLAQTATITPYQSVNQSLQGLLSMESTVLAPVTASSGG